MCIYSRLGSSSILAMWRNVGADINNCRWFYTFLCSGDANGNTEVKLDAKIAAKTLPPPPFKGIVKGAT